MIEPKLNRIALKDVDFSSQNPIGLLKEAGSKFADALAFAEMHGDRIRRKSWPEGVFVFVQVPCEVPVGIISKMSSLPQPVKDHFVSTGKPIQYCEQMGLVTPDNIVRGWLPLPEDAEADDWIVLDFKILKRIEPWYLASTEETVGAAQPITPE